MTDSPTTSASVAASLTDLRRELMELGGPNTLLWPAKDSAVVDLTTAHPGGIAMLLSGRAARLSDLVREPGALLQIQRHAARLTEHVDRIEEEHGVLTCFLAMGLVSWDVPGEDERPTAPVLLRRAALRRLRPGPDFALDLADRVEVNPALLTYLRRALHREVDGERLADLGRTEGAGYNPTPVYAAVRAECADLPGLSVTEHLTIAAYPYGKAEALADFAALADDEQRAKSPALRALLTGEPLAARTDPVTSTADTAVMDVTSDQQDVLDRVAAAESLYVDAPPGTGPARLVAAVIAATTAQGRSVLLLTEKPTAIHGVADELEQAGLADLLAHAHDPAAAIDPDIIVNRWPARAFDDDPAPGRTAAEAAAVLEGHTEAMHTTRDPWGVSIADAHDAIVKLSTERPAPRSRVRLTGETLAAIDRDGCEALAAQLTGVATRRAWRPARSDQPWAGARLHSHDDVNDVLAAVDRLRGEEGSLARLTETVRDVFADIAEPRAASPADYGHFLAGIEAIRDTLDVFRPEVFDTPLDHLLAATSPTGSTSTPADGEPMGIFERRRLRAQAARLLRPGRPPADLHAALTLASTQRRSWSRLTGGGGRPRIPADIDRAHHVYELVYADLTHLGAVLTETPTGGALLDAPWDELTDRLDDLAKDVAGARTIPEVIDDLDDLRARGLGDLLDDLATRRVDPSVVASEVRFVWWSSVLAQASLDVRYHQVTGEQLDSALTTFLTADRASLGDNAARIARRQRDHFRVVGRRMRAEAREVANAAAGRGSPPTWGTVLERWGGLLRAAAPAWAMSPFVVGQVLPGRQHFDLVIVDDASRTTLARALSGMASGGQLLIIGDRGQLPPRTWSADAGVAAPQAPAESLADRAAALLPTAALRDSAYPRPRLATLLTGSAGEVVHPPAPRVREDIDLIQVDGHGVLDERTGLVETSPAEVAAVLDLVRTHLTQHPRRSLGIVTFGSVHAERIKHAVAELTEANPPLADAVAALPEPLVIKPVDRWQREQRDRVIVTVGYGRTPQGRVIRRLGELSGPGGDQLVVLAATRARGAATWVSAMTADDLDGERGDLPGHRALRTLLTGLAATPESPTEQESELSPLLAGFVERLRTRGLVVHPGVGTGKHRIDIAVADPRDTSRMLVAVDVDGPDYAGLASARQRDRVLVDRLVGLGWHHLRLWAVDIFADPARQEAQVALAVRLACEKDES